jgi:hypothetical protein
MKNTVLVALIILLLVPLAWAEEGKAPGAVEALISEEVSREDSQAAMSYALEHPREVVPLLLSELHPIKEVKLQSPADYEENQEKERGSMRVVNSLRALCAITGGQRFTSPSQFVFAKPAPDPELPPGVSSSEENREYWLTFNGREKMPFYAVWPSRGVIYIAPREVQESVILQWKEWYAREGDAFPYRMVEDYEGCGGGI